MLNRAIQSLRNLPNQTDLVLAWLAIFLWGTTWAWGYTGLDGIANFFHRLLTWNFAGYQPTIFEDMFMLVIAVFYWLFFVGVLFLLPC